MDKEFAEVFKEEIVIEGKIEELGKQIAGLADKFKEGKDDVMTMADEMITNGAMPDPEMIKMLETEEADMVIHLIAKKMGVQWTKDNGYGEMRFKQNYPESHIKKNADRLREMSNKIKEASKLPPHLAKFFDKKGNLKPEVAARIAKGREKLNIKDVTPKGYGPKEEVEIKEDPDLEKIVKELEGASKMHLGQSKRIQKHLDKMDKMNVEIGEAMNPKDHVKEKDGKFQVISPKGKVVYSSDDKKEAEEWAVKNHDDLMKEGIDIEKADMKDVIKDFQSSDAPQFKGKSDKKKKEMAIAAKLSKEEFEIDESTKEYAKSLEKIANDRTLKSLSKSERENLKKIADLLAKEDLEIEGAAEFMAAASAAKKEGKKKFKFGGKEYPVTIKVDIPLANEEIANSVGGGGIAGLDTGLTAKKKKDDTDKAKKLRKQYLKGAGITEEVQRTTFAGKDVFIVDSDTFHNCRMGKKKYGRYETYVGDGEVGQTIREYGLKYPRRPIILQNGDSGPMLYLKYGRS